MRVDQIILEPKVTEKSNKLREALGKYTFLVHKDVNKLIIKDTIKKIFNVVPLSINIINVPGKLKRVRFKRGYTPGYKKAIVTLKKGDVIPLFEGAK